MKLIPACTTPKSSHPGHTSTTTTADSISVTRFTPNDQEKAAEVLLALRRAGGTLSMADIASSRSLGTDAVDKYIACLRGLGYEIEAGADQRYRLLKSPDIPYSWEIKNGLTTRWLGRQVVFVSEVDSTNELVRKLAREGAPAGLVVVAERQTAGRGRSGRMWISPAQKGLWFSLLLRPTLQPSVIPPLALYTAVAVATTIRKLYQLKAEVKWPNDVMIADRKLCGILMEMSAEAESIRHLVIGIGINVNMAQSELPPDVGSTATSLSLLLNRPVSRLPLLQALLVNLERCFDQFSRVVEHAGLMAAVRRLSCTIGRDVVVRGADLPSAGFSGRAVAIEDDGSLKIEAAGGEVRWFHSGEVSVRPRL
jgi:BirA family biotin operon repressor/biotin-[acetyl-CoA-carboxylase] ligase